MTLPSAKYPGDTVKIQRFTKGEEIGDVRIQQYDSKYRAGCFLPGVIVDNPGDTTKVEPERNCWRNTEAGALRAFSIYLRMAKQQGWSESP